ncbi:MAG: glycoside hydrolase family 97 catalytic domain-containing protein [Candidatus Methylacidiphilales bacterium]|nr:glycoside hydrolase family 97 catalytic domain-containing protein [Candidatus Methylacidiphilales bacterium]
MKTRYPSVLTLCGLFSLSIAGFCPASAIAAPFKVTSPDGTVAAEVSDVGGELRYTIKVDGREVLSASPVGLRADGVEYGSNATLGEPAIRTINEKYRYWGGRSQAVNNARVATAAVTASGQPCEIDVHVGDDGVAVRLRLPAKNGRQIQADNSGWRLPGNPVVWAATGPNIYENTYSTTQLSKLDDNKDYELPLTAKVGDTYIALSQALLKDYGDIVLRAKGDGLLQSRLYADKNGWTTNDPVIQPWRVTIVARSLDALVNTTLVSNLNPPAPEKLVNADWIRPGRCAWQWMAVGAPKSDDQQQWVDWTRELSYEYYLVDEGWSKWPNAWETLAAVCAHAKERNVKIWLWVHSRDVRTAEARRAYFQKAIEAGVVGVKIDFPRATDRWWSNWYYDTAADAADLKLMVDFHGCMVATGLERTWPNVLTREAVRGHEWHITRYKRVLDPGHDTIIPFTRYLAGPADYTPTVFEVKELQGNTWAHELAQLFAFNSPFLCTGGHPRDYLANPAKDFVMAAPAVWDETRVLPASEPGKLAVFARRTGNTWFIVALNGGEEQTVDLPLDFLSEGQWKFRRAADQPGKPDAFDLTEGLLSSNDRVKATLAPRGGLVIWIRK